MSAKGNVVLRCTYRVPPLADYSHSRAHSHIGTDAKWSS